MFRKIINLCIVLLLSTSVYAQDALKSLQADFQSVADSVDHANSVSVLVTAKAYASRGGTLISTYNAARYESGSSSKVRIDELEIIETKQFALRVDHEEKSLLVIEKTQSTGKPKMEKMEFDVKALKKFLEDSGSEQKPIVKLVSDNAGIRKYTISGIEGIRLMEVTLNTSKRMIQTISFEYGSPTSPGQFVLLDYAMSYNTNVSTQFELSAYFTKKNNEIILSPKLQGYKLYTEL